MERGRTGCISMAMNESTLWPIEMPLLIDGRITKRNSKFGTTTEIRFHIPICFHSSSSPTTSLYSSKTTKEQPQDRNPAPKPKGDGQSLMVSNFLTTEWGHLRDGDRCVKTFFYWLHSLIIDLERPALCSNQGRTATGIST